MAIALSKLEKLQSIPKDIRLHKHYIEQLNEYLDILKDNKYGASTIEMIKQDQAEHEARIEALETLRRETITEIAALPEKQREILLLRYDAGWTWDAIAEALNMSVRWVYRIRRAAIDQREND